MTTELHSLLFITLNFVDRATGSWLVEVTHAVPMKMTMLPVFKHV